MKILLTGGTGYIGSHTCVELLNNNYEVIIVDNLCNSQKTVIDKIEKISGKKVVFYQTDLLDFKSLNNVFSEHNIDAVIHFAGLKAVNDSINQPLNYYHNNITGTIHLCQLMERYKINKIIFSSSATVYGNPATLPIKEDFPLNPTNPYGRTKLFIEHLLQDLYLSNPSWNITLLRYFNPIGAHPSGLIGENPQGTPNNLFPYLTQVASGKLPYLNIFGNDYPTPDGTAIRDYIHVMDLANGHLKALEKSFQSSGINIYNLGTGHGYSVKEVINAFEKSTGQQIPYQIAPRRPGDIPISFADPSKANNQLNWQAQRTLENMCQDGYKWQQNNK